MKNFCQYLWYQLCDIRLQSWLRFLCSLSCIGFGLTALADSGDDLLQGTDASWWATFNGTGKIYLYTGEAIFAILLFIKSRNLGVFIGIIALAVFIDIYLHLAGQSA